MANQEKPMNTSLYVGDLHEQVSEADLYTVFKDLGPVLSIRVCRDNTTKKSLGYAYVNYQNALDAERAIEKLNHCKLRGREIRIMWCTRDPALRKSGNGNLFIKNLKLDISTKMLRDTFETFGKILSCKVVTDESGKSKGYGYIHFAEPDAAAEAIEKVHNMMLNEQQVHVGHFERKEKKLQSLNDTFTNVYVKHFDINAEESELCKYFEQFGKVKSLSVQKQGNGGVMYINYESHDDAATSVEQLNGTEQEGVSAPGKKLVVVRHQRKAEREHTKATERKEREQQYAKYANLYVKNLDDSVNTETLRDAFKEFGKIMSCKVMTHPDSSVSKGFGFVSFEEQASAKAAMEKMYGRMLSGKPLYVAEAQKKDARKAELEQRFSKKNVGMGGPGIPGINQMSFPNPVPGFNNTFPGQGGFGGGFMGGQRGPGGQMGGMPGMSRVQPPQLNRVGPMGQRQFPGALGGHVNPALGMGGMNMGMGGMGGMGLNRGPQGPQGPRPGMGMGGPAPMGGGPNRGPMGAGPMGMNRGALDPSRLANMAPKDAKTHLGEQLYQKIQEIESAHAAKITGMLLEMDNAEIINLLDSPSQLYNKVNEALAVLRKHQDQQSSH